MHALWRSLCPDRLDTTVGESPEQVIYHGIAAPQERRRKATPKHPPRTFQHALPLHVIGPLVGPVVLVAIALNGQPRIVVALHDHVDAVLAHMHLRRDPIASSGEVVVDLPLKRRLA